MLIGLAAGIFVGFAFDVSYPSEYSFYISMGLLAAMDSLLERSGRIWKESITISSSSADF